MLKECRYDISRTGKVCHRVNVSIISHSELIHFCHCHYLQSSNCPWLVCLLYLGSVGSSKGFCRPFVVAITCHLLYILAYQSLVAYCITQYQYVIHVLVIWRYSCNKYIIVIFTSTRQNVPSDILTFTFRSVKKAEIMLYMF